MPKLPTLRAHELISVFQRAGFETIRQRGSHVRLKHPDGRVVTIPVHAGQDLGRGLLCKILRDAEWTIEDLYTFLKQD